MTTPARRRHRRSPITLAGWLFADLFLVLMLTALATQGRVASKPPPKAAPSPGPGPSRGATRAPCPVSYELKPVDLRLVGLSFAGLRSRDDAAVQAMIGQVQSQLREKNVGGRYAGLVLAFGISTYAHLDDAGATALAAGEILTERLPRFRGAKVREFKIEIGGSGDPAVDRGNQLTLSVYFFVRC